MFSNNDSTTTHTTIDFINDSGSTTTYSTGYYRIEEEYNEEERLNGYNSDDEYLVRHVANLSIKTLFKFNTIKYDYKRHRRKTFNKCNRC